jgi:hypothetical protein
VNSYFFATLLIAALPASFSQAAIVGSFRQLETGKTHPMVLIGPWDTWVFEVQSDDLNYDALELHFTAPTGGFLNNGGETFRNTATPPVTFGFETTDTFFIVPPGQVFDAITEDTPTTLRSAFAVAGAITIVPNNSAKIAVAYFSVNSGEQLGSANFVYGLAVSQGGPIHTITYGDLVPEPAAFSSGVIIISIILMRLRIPRCRQCRAHYR